MKSVRGAQGGYRLTKDPSEYTIGQIRRLTEGCLSPVPCLDENGAYVKPEKPNGYKFEQLVLDMIHELDSCLPFEVERNKEFAPIKNATGVDSVESARTLCKENGIEL